MHLEVFENFGRPPPRLDQGGFSWGSLRDTARRKCHARCGRFLRKLDQSYHNDYDPKEFLPFFPSLHRHLLNEYTSETGFKMGSDIRRNLRKDLPLQMNGEDLR